MQSILPDILGSNILPFLDLDDHESFQSTSKGYKSLVSSVFITQVSSAKNVDHAMTTLNGIVEKTIHIYELITLNMTTRLDEITQKLNENNLANRIRSIRINTQLIPYGYIIFKSVQINGTRSFQSVENPKAQTQLSTSGQKHKCPGAPMRPTHSRQRMNEETMRPAQAAFRTLF